MNKILLVQQYLGSNNEIGPVFPIGLAYISTAIREIGWTVSVLDMNVCEDPYDDLKKAIGDFRPDVLGISLRNIDNVDLNDFNYFYLEFLRLVSFLKESNATIVVGGAGFSIFGKRIMRTVPEIDFGICHEGELTLTELLLSLNSGLQDYSNIKGLYYREGNRIIYTGIRSPLDFSKSSIPDRSLFNMKKYNKPLCIGVQTKRGCRLKCSYCTYPYINQFSERFRSPDSIVDEIEHLQRQYGIEEVIFCDDIFNSPLKHAEDIIRKLKERDVKIRWSAWFDIANTSIEFMREAIASGCYRFCFSTEGVTDASLKCLRKNFNTNQVYALVKSIMHKEFKDIDFRFSLFALPPALSYIGLFKTLFFVYKTHVTRRNVKCLVSWIRIYPHTALYDSLPDQGVELLPEKIDKRTLNEIFWNKSKFPKLLIGIYKNLFILLDRIRKFNKKVFWT